MQDNDTLTKAYSHFIADLLIPSWNVQAGTVKEVEVILNAENYHSFLIAHEGQDLFFLSGVDPVRGMERARDEDVRSKGHFFFDFDIRTQYPDITDEEIRELGKWFAGALADHPYLSLWRYIVFSGNGIHVHYFGDPVQLVSAEHWREGMRFIMEEVKKHTRMEPDIGCSNAGRLGRLPGSYNHKNGKRTKVEILLARPGVKMDIALVEKFGAEMIRRAQAPESEGKEKKWEAGLEGVGNGKRNETAASVAGRLLHGIAEDLWEMSGWGGLKEWNKRNTPPLPEKELRSVFDSIKTSEQRGRKKEHLKKPTHDQPSRPVVVCLDDVVREDVQWLWKDRLPQGKFTIMEGDPSAGKSWLSLAIASAVTTGASFPGDDAKRGPANVLLLNAEDAPADTIRPRLEGMEADLKRIYILTAVQDGQGKERHFSLDKDLAAIEEVLLLGGFSLLVIDPINAYLGSSIDANSDPGIRSVLTPLSKLAELHRVTVIGIRHLTKSSRSRAMYRGQGSIGYTAAARVVHLVGINPMDASERVMVCIKNNLAPFPPSIAYEVKEGLFLWKGESEITADSILDSDSANSGSAMDEAKKFLRETLSIQPRRAAEVEREAEDAGISLTTLKRAKKDIGILTDKIGGKDGFWMWKLPNSAKETNSSGREGLASFETTHVAEQMKLPATAILPL
ncbi:MAG: AAA family ATPase [Candidatus Peregrinibacteria bacterium]